MNRCIPCGYDLAGRAVGERCPECGAPIPPMDLGGAWNDAVVRRRFAIGAWLFMAVVPSVLPGVLVSWLTDFHPRVTFWLVALPPIACAVAAAALIDRGRPQPAVRRRRPGVVLAIGVIPLLALTAAIATMLDIGRARDTAGLVAFSLMLVFAAAMGVMAGRMRRQISPTPSASAAIAIVIAVLAHVAFGFLFIGGGDEVERMLLSGGCMLLAAPCALLCSASAFLGTHFDLRRRFGGTG